MIWYGKCEKFFGELFFYFSLKEFPRNESKEAKIIGFTRILPQLEVQRTYCGLCWTGSERNLERVAFITKIAAPKTSFFHKPHSETFFFFLLLKKRF